MKWNKRTTALAAIGLVGYASTARAADSTNAAPAAAPKTTLAGTVIGEKANKGFFSRLDQSFRDEFGTPAYVPPDTNAPPSSRRLNPSPFDSPPFPTGEWQIGGTEVIGDANITPDYPLMQAIYQGPHGQAWADSNIKIYGWVDFSANMATSDKSAVNNTTPPFGNSSNPGGGPGGPAGVVGATFPEVYDQRPNRVELNQAVLYLERTPDEAQVDHVDWGFRISAVYGLDYVYMISKGLFSYQLLHDHNWYGYDMPMVYANIYIPWVAQGLNLTIGRIISEADIEAQLAPNNPMSSHSLLYGFDPYTQDGIFSTLTLNRNWKVQAGLANGGDVQPWVNDPGNQPTGTVMFQYQSSNNKFSFYGGANQFNNGEWGYNNMQQYVGTLSYKFNEKVWTTWETWYMYQHDAATGPTASVPNINASFPVKPGYAPEWASLNYTMFRLAPSTFFTVRNEIFDDIVGQRTGYATVYSEHSIGITYWPNKLITFRPELRFDHSYAERSFDLGTRHNQFTAQFDVIVHF
jgi:hypothetical protein